MTHYDETTGPPPPEPEEPSAAWEHFGLWQAVRKALFTLPSQFESELAVSGVLATDLFAFNSSLGATIEEQVVSSLNKLRSLWDPDRSYALYSFERQPQTFPDVVLRASAPGVEPRVILGIELKGWYVLAKEREPSFRYKVTSAVCAPQDLLVVVPWALSNVISGSPQVFMPFVVGARQAAEYRNWYWQHRKGGTGDRTIDISTVTKHYPVKSDPIIDVSAADQSNFGRLARTGIMDEYIAELFDERLAGIPVFAWQKFLALFTERQTTDDIAKGMDRLEAAVEASDVLDLSEEAIAEIATKFADICRLLRQSPS